MKNATKRLVLIAVLFLATTSSFAQSRPDEGTVGLSASVQSSQTNIKVPIWVSEDIVIAPLVGLTHQDDNFTSINLGINPRFYQSLGNDFATYIGVQGILQNTSYDSDVDDDDSDFLIGATGGGEYFLDEHFSLGVEGQLNFLLDDSDNNSIFTATALTGTFYF
ncbi:hypothetical protein [Fodinibius salsisoli]|uniref:Outer membrane protein beta-barrel domain-containing protein n=1 Tax=Fodinibius salsisoli TaxID=2820877 RepID=A0ABT3PTC8_9BACT|nr:hypothetical protein [Fodinibius salsisoli]MCW9709082.1 hypothetical protein [Fodinibius salsisoli]